MSESQVIARKFRPQTFPQVIGQEAITRTLSNSLASNRLHHAYLFTGARGVGKTTTARIFAKALNCATGPTPDPCGVCASCTEIAESRSLDVHEIDAATYTKVEDTRDVIISTIGISPARDRYKIFIIDEVHMLSTSSFNALLKSVEEPPDHIVFILATTEMQKVPDTILSRCQIFEFRTITLKRISEQLRHIAGELGIEVGDSALAAIGRAGGGSMRDAESALDQVISFSGNRITDDDVSAALGLVDSETLNKTIRAIAEQDTAGILHVVDDVVTRGYDLRNFCRELITQLRALLVIKVAGFDAELVELPANEGEQLAQVADAFSEQDIVRFFSILTKTEVDMRVSTQPRFQLEIGLIKLLHARRLYLLEDALKQLADLQTRLGLGAAGSGSRSTAVAPSTHAPVATPSRRVPVPPKPAAPPRRASLPALDPSIASEAPVGRSQATPRPRDTNAAPKNDRAVAPDEPAMPKPRVEPDAEAILAGAQSSNPGEATDAVHLIIAAVENRGRRLLFDALQNASVRIDGDFLVVAIAPERAVDKQQVEPKDKKQLLEEISREVTGRRLTVSVSVGAQPLPEAVAARPRAESRKEPVEIPATVQALADTFGAEKVEIVKPEQP